MPNIIPKAPPYGEDRPYDHPGTPLQGTTGIRYVATAKLATMISNCCCNVHHTSRDTRTRFDTFNRQFF